MKNRLRLIVPATPLLAAIKQLNARRLYLLTVGILHGCAGTLHPSSPGGEEGGFGFVALEVQLVNLQNDPMAPGYSGNFDTTGLVRDELVQTRWSPWNSPLYEGDSDGIILKVESNGQYRDTDVRFLIQLRGEGQEGSIQHTPWASEGGGWSEYSTGAGWDDFEAVRVGVETKALPGFAIEHFRGGVRVEDQGKPGLPRLTGWSPPTSSASSGTATDENYHDPDGAAIFLETRPPELPRGWELCVILSEHIGLEPFASGDLECTGDVYSPGMYWSDWAFDQNAYDPDAIQLGLLENSVTSFVIRDLDVRLWVQVIDAGDVGEAQATPWASEGGGWSPMAMDPNSYDFDGVRVGIEVQEHPGLEFHATSFGIRLADQGGVQPGLPKTAAPGGYTEVAIDLDGYDPDAVAIYFETELMP
jgi:hypothetical protein